MIASYTATCSDSDGILVNTLTTINLTTLFGGLSPYSFYSCSVFATTSGGNGPAATLNFTTVSDGRCMRCNLVQCSFLKNEWYTLAVPGDSPANVQVVGNSPSSVLVTWIVPLTPNGIITGYNLYVNYSDGSPIAILQSSASTTNYTLTNLRPYQLVTVQVSASTVAGEGPMSEPVMGRSREEGSYLYIVCKISFSTSSV